MKTLKRLSGCLRKRFLCQKKGSLGVKTLELFNISLLAKWRCLVDCDVLWYDLLEFKYGPLNSNIFLDEGIPTNASRWWRDLVSIELVGRGNSLWFSDAVGKKLGNGTRIKFWCDRRLGLECLKNVFPRLYQVATQKDATVSQMGSWCGGHYKKFGY